MGVPERRCSFAEEYKERNENFLQNQTDVNLEDRISNSFIWKDFRIDSENDSHM